VYGTRRELRVNSRHHQAVTTDRLAPALVALAYSPEGLVEAVESRSQRWVVGVQWHPERLEPEHSHFAPAMRPLFEALVTVARGARSGVA
jgi:putative glutamine amidotransferase